LVVKDGKHVYIKIGITIVVLGFQDNKRQVFITNRTVMTDNKQDFAFVGLDSVLECDR
jgi:hypothetical protein